MFYDGTSVDFALDFLRWVPQTRVYPILRVLKADLG